MVPIFSSSNNDNNYILSIPNIAYIDSSIISFKTLLISSLPPPPPKKKKREKEYSLSPVFYEIFSLGQKKKFVSCSPTLISFYSEKSLPLSFSALPCHYQPKNYPKIIKKKLPIYIPFFDLQETNIFFYALANDVMKTKGDCLEV